MRVLLTTALMLMSGTAMASSITPLESHGGNRSIVTKTCATCPPVKRKGEVSNYTVPVLETGSQKTEIVETDGEKRLIRTEAWLGGSPVVHVSKASAWMAPKAPEAQDGIDHEATVGAVEAGMTGSAETASTVNTEAMSLRLK